jgi:tartrate dehydrogenase/decarboxylase / D-malate dehydrogenase
MAEHKIAVIAGDGIGVDVIREGIRTVEAVGKLTGAKFHFHHLPWSSKFYLETGHIVPPGGWEELQKHDAIFFGAIGSPQVPEKVTVHGLLLPMRRMFDQYVNLRPAYLYPGVSCPLKDKAPGSIDFLVYRENTEGEYAPIGGRLYEKMDAEIAIQTSVFTRRGCERIIRAAFHAAMKRKKQLTVVTKSNALVYGLQLWDEAAASVAKEFPEVQMKYLLVDAAAMDFVRKPESFDVVVASNLFGDILTDLSAQVTGSVGLASSANINPERSFPSMFEPVHGSAPDIAGKGIANPLAAILSAALMLDHLKEEAAAAKLRSAVASVLAGGKAMSPDLGGTATTTQVADAVIAAL